eukprot:SAG11_NODE_16528_length_545_cov_0.704036_1_plen_78_part_10
MKNGVVVVFGNDGKTILNFIEFVLPYCFLPPQSPPRAHVHYLYVDLSTINASPAEADGKQVRTVRGTPYVRLTPAGLA